MTSPNIISRESGFTLVECLVAVAVTGILAATAIANPVSQYVTLGEENSWTVGMWVLP